MPKQIQDGFIVLEDGGMYRPVAPRILELRARYPLHTIHTEVLETDQNYVLCKTSVLHPMTGRVLATGHALEMRGSNPFTTMAPVETTETSAVGRCLSFLGFYPNPDDEPGVVEIDGEPYDTVLHRLRKFHAARAGWAVVTALEHQEGGTLRFRAEVRDDTDRLVATGLAERITRPGEVSECPLECCETAAVGRALGFAGFGNGKTATAEEVLFARLGRTEEGPSKRSAKRPQKPGKTAEVKRFPDPEAGEQKTASQPSRPPPGEKLPAAVAGIIDTLRGCGFGDNGSNRFVVETGPEGFTIAAWSQQNRAMLQSLGFLHAGQGRFELLVPDVRLPEGQTQTPSQVVAPAPTKATSATVLAVVQALRQAGGTDISALSETAAKKKAQTSANPFYSQRGPQGWTIRAKLTTPDAGPFAQKLKELGFAPVGEPGERTLELTVQNGNATQQGAQQHAAGSSN